MKVESCGLVLFRLQWSLGGILIMWDKRVVEKVDVSLGEFTLAVSFRNVVV
jgi:hypothetical protein